MLMPPVESSAAMVGDNDSQSRDDITGQTMVTDGVSSPAGCENPDIGSGDSPRDETDDDSRKLFVGGLSSQTSEGDLKEYFSRWGKVTQCIIKLDRYTGNSRGFGFVTMENEDCVCKVLSVSDHWLKNKRIDPKKAKPSKETVRKVFVGGIDPDVTEDQIKKYFSAFGKVESLDLPFDMQKGKRKHYIFVSFATEAAARKAIAKERQEIFGRLCDVRVAVTREQANRQKALKQWSAWIDPYAYAGHAYNDLSNAYFGYDPFLYSYYGYDLYGSTGATSGYAAYPQSMTPNHFRALSSGSKTPQCQRDSSGTMGTGTSTNRLLGGTTASSGSVSTHRPQQTPHANLNFGLLNATLEHHAPLSTGLDFGTPHSLHAAQGMVASATAGYPHP